MGGTTSVETLERGARHVHLHIDGQDVDPRAVPAFPRRIDEVKAFDADTGAKIRGKPVINQDKTIEDVVASLAGGTYPNVAIIGGPGIGKTSLMDLIVGVVTGEVPMSVMQTYYPNTVSNLKQIQQRAKLFAHRDYLLLPNLAEPMQPISLDYTDSIVAERDQAVAEAFCRDMRLNLGTYGTDHRFQIKTSMKLDEYKTFIRSAVSEMYVELYTQVAQLVEGSGAKKDTTRKPEFALVELDPPKDADSFATTATWRFVKGKTGGTPNVQKWRHHAGYTPRVKSLTTADIERGLANTFVAERVKPLLANLLWETTFIDVEGQDEDALFTILQQEMAAYNKDTPRPLAKQYEVGVIHSQREMLAALRTSVSVAYPVEISSGTIDDVIGLVRTTRERYASVDVSPQLKEWMDGVVSYFSTERQAIGKNMRTIHGELRDAERNQTPEIKMQRKKTYKKSAKVIRVNNDGEILDEDDDDRTKEKPKSVGFNLNHDGATPVSDIFQIAAFRNSAASGKVSSVKIREFSPGTLYAVFAEKLDLKGKKSSPIPPHMRIKALGNMFKGGIVVFPDSFDDYIQSIAGSSMGDGEGGSQNMRDLYLEFFETGKLTIVNDGVQYQFMMPRMFVGTANDNPFVTRQDGFVLRHEQGLQDRFTVIDVDSYTHNTPQVREGTLAILRRFEGEYRKRTNHVRIAPDAMEGILRLTEFDETIATTAYRDLKKILETLLTYGATHGKKDGNDRVVDMDTLHRFARERVPADMFWSVDSQEHSFNHAFMSRPQRTVGDVNGLYVVSSHDQPAALLRAQHASLAGLYGLSAVESDRLLRVGQHPAIARATNSSAAGPQHLGVGGVTRCNSYFVQGQDTLRDNMRRFELVDGPTGLAAESAVKGHVLAADFLTRLLYQKGQKAYVSLGWQLKTQFVENWQGMGGPSASMAFAMSMLSALAGDGEHESEHAIHKNRFFTGTIDAATGEARAIGGTYYKGLVPNRIGQLLGDEGKDTELYFLYPATNHRDFTKSLLLDPFGLEKRVTCLPIHTFEQVYYLATCGEKISKDDWLRSFDKGGAQVARAVERGRAKIFG